MLPRGFYILEIYSTILIFMYLATLEQVAVCLNSILSINKLCGQSLSKIKESIK